MPMSNKILVCDDDESIGEVLKIMLESDGFEVMGLQNGKGIQKKVEQFDPNLILLDIWMPGIDGKEITKLLKENPATRNIPIILISALNDTSKIAMECGADGFLTKPFDMHHLLSTVRSHLA
jgi:DNA-binding response OmpR family regulator